jgi:hypothetical protein
MAHDYLIFLSGDAWKNDGFPTASPEYSPEPTKKPTNPPIDPAESPFPTLVRADFLISYFFAVCN